MADVCMDERGTDGHEVLEFHIETKFKENTRGNTVERK